MNFCMQKLAAPLWLESNCATQVTIKSILNIHIELLNAQTYADFFSKSDLSDAERENE